jgi:hypothetical protein
MEETRSCLKPSLNGFIAIDEKKEEAHQKHFIYSPFVISSKYFFISTSRLHSS